MAYAGRTAVRVLPTWDEVSERTWWREGGKHWLFRSVDAAKGNRDGADLAARYGLPRARIAHVPQSIGGEHYSQALDLEPALRVQLRNQLGVSGCVFVYAGRLIWKKGLDALFDAFAKVRALEPDVSLLILGDGFDEWHYRAAAREIGGVSFTGFVRRSDLPCLYACGDVFVFPSLGEPNGLVLDEALAAGLPAISSDAVGDIHHRVRDGENGFVVASGDADGMAARMLQLARDPDLRARLAAAAPGSVPAPDHQIYAEAFERFVEQALRVPGRRSGGARAARGLGRAMVALGGRDAPAAVMAPRAAGLAQATVVERLRDPA
jgi:glycosyltransferase involved in cell wall biosynthesis